MQSNIYQQYKTQSLETLTKGEIVVKLFGEASKQINTAIFLLGKSDNVTAFNCIVKAQKIVSTLRRSLDMRIPISLQLDDLYSFIYAQLGEGIVNKDTVLLKHMSEMLDDFRETFRKADMIARSNSISGVK